MIEVTEKKLVFIIDDHADMHHYTRDNHPLPVVAPTIRKAPGRMFVRRAQAPQCRDLGHCAP